MNRGDCSPFSTRTSVTPPDVRRIGEGILRHSGGLSEPSGACAQSLPSLHSYRLGGGSVGIAVYDDRLEVTSSGSLHFGLTPEKLFAPHESRPWNPLIARTFYRRGVIEEWGSGTLKIAELTSSAGLPVPEIEDDGGAVTVRFRPSVHFRVTFVAGKPTVDVRPRVVTLPEQILALLDRAEDGLTRREILSLLGPAISERQVRRTLENLKDKGLVTSTARGPLTRWRRVAGAR